MSKLVGMRLIQCALNKVNIFRKWLIISAFLFKISGGEVAFVDYSKGDPKGHVRLSVEGSGKTLFAKLEDGKVRFTAPTRRIPQSNRIFPPIFSSKSMILRPLPNCWRAMRKSHIWSKPLNRWNFDESKPASDHVVFAADKIAETIAEETMIELKAQSI